MAEDDEEMQATHDDRMKRLQRLRDEIKKNKKMLVSDVIKFAMDKWLLSLRIINEYIKELVASGDFRVTAERDGDYIEYLGGA
jgi:hypothetical protein